MDLSATSELIIAGWTGRDPHGVQHHIDELAKIGVPPPSRTPLFYRVAADRLTQDTAITVVGHETSGEVEPILVWTDDGLHVGVGSDHTDRAAERFGVAIAKQLCPKITGREFWRYDEVVEHWDQIVLRSFKQLDGVESLYQQGNLSALLPPETLISRYREGGFGELRPGCVMFCGTVPAIGGIARADALTIELHDPVLGTTLRHQYSVRELPIVE